MLNKIARCFFIGLGLLLLWASTSRTAMQYLFTLRDVKHKWWGMDELDHGDLASMAYLYHVNRFAHANWVEPPHAAYTGPKRTALYIQGDSYTRYIKDTQEFAGLVSYQFMHRNREVSCTLDTGRNNVLILEISERYFRDYFSELTIFNELHVQHADAHTTTWTNGNGIAPSYAAVFPLYLSVDSFFNRYINQNLQFNMVNYQLIMPLFTTKAALNYYLFSRASGDVVISDDKRFLFLRETVAPYGAASSYAPLSDEVIANLVGNLNNVYKHYKMEGFAEVYLSIIPNSATINQPGGYNHLIPAIQGDRSLRMKVLDVYTPFKNEKEDVYLPGDTHWNTRGLTIWLNQVNNAITQ